MSKYLIENTTLTSIADAVREKAGTTELIKVSELPDAIAAIESGGGADLPEETLIIIDNCSYRFANNGWNWFIENYGDKITTKDITDGSYMFAYTNNLKEIPFEINFKSSVNSSISSMFIGNMIYTMPKVNNIRVSAFDNMFSSCRKLREIPEDYFDNWDWSYLKSLTNEYSGKHGSLFNGCWSLRKMPLDFIKNVSPYAAYNSSAYYRGFTDCNSLDEIVNLPIPYTASTWTYNAFISTFYYCNRLKELTFETNDDNSPIVVKWKSQTIDLTSGAGWVSISSKINNILNLNSGITADKQVIDDASYQTLKNDPDWFAAKIAYSRYNHDSAVNTINSLPDTSAYLATQTSGTNTIKFKGAAGELTDGGAINTLTEEEIAVATAKGWTVTFV